VSDQGNNLNRIILHFSDFTTITKDWIISSPFLFIFVSQLIENKMEHLNECITFLITAGISAIVRYFEKKRMLKDLKESEHFKK